MNVVVLAGGLSTERDVSISSGSLICAALKRAGHNAILVDVFLGTENLNSSIEDVFKRGDELLKTDIGTEVPDIETIKATRGESIFGDIGTNVIELCKAADIVYMGLHGENGENGRLQALFDVIKVKYTGTGYLGSALAMNKALTKQLLLANGVLTAAGIVITNKDKDSISIIGGIKMPCIIKPCSGGSSIGISIARNKDELNRAIDEAFKYENEVLIEEYIEGREFSVGILGDKVLPIIEIIPNEGFYDYSHKYQKGWTKEVCPADLDDVTAKNMQDAACKVNKVLKLEVYSRIDFILDKDNNIYCLEANTLPGMTPTSLLPQEALNIGISYEELCEEIIKLSLLKNQE
ncbi:MAG: D-alanine--D-alanine ligase [Eubacteriales bacterium]